MHVSPTADQIRRMSAVAANYNGLQGLTMVPVSLWMFAYGAAVLFSPAAMLWVAAALVVVIGASVLIARAYRHRFGRVRQGGFAVHAATVITALVAFILAALVLNLIGWKAGGGQGNPIWPFGIQFALVIAIAFFLPPVLRGRTLDMSISRHWQVMCALLVLVSLVPLGLLTGGMVHPLNVTYEIGMASNFWTMGVCFLIGGLCDHRLLMNSLGAAPTGER
ncbi:hypothetical protein CLV63_102146 [Murinocardiopsis flavida]|uniref:Uncharacterized protein n=1 Tax=Murinocardiopsis flavida TaxID=645275 RepID=A0A2P8DS28_9ACTN|nr:hypothetical protein [Murinocardiopsis flavida]PSL00020.1 hypothetical protein CLV63_102146 [Murinocardiopsis flavida]